jgi:hypothetical protein
LVGTKRGADVRLFVVLDADVRLTEDFFDALTRRAFPAGLFRRVVAFAAMFDSFPWDSSLLWKKFTSLPIVFLPPKSVY